MLAEAALKTCESAVRIGYDLSRANNSSVSYPSRLQPAGTLGMGVAG